MRHDRDDLDRPARRAAAAARLGVHGDFIHVPQLARALGISSTAIYAQMRKGHFPVPHRKVGKVALVKLDDYLAWFESGASIESAPPAVSGLAATAIGEGAASPTVDAPASMKKDPKHVKLQSGESRAAFRARINREVRDGMRRKGFDV